MDYKIDRFLQNVFKQFVQRLIAGRYLFTNISLHELIIIRAIKMACEMQVDKFEHNERYLST